MLLSLIVAMKLLGILLHDIIESSSLNIIAKVCSKAITGSMDNNSENFFSANHCVIKRFSIDCFTPTIIKDRPMNVEDYNAYYLAILDIKISFQFTNIRGTLIWGKKKCKYFVSDRVATQIDPIARRHISCKISINVVSSIKIWLHILHIIIFAGIMRNRSVSDAQNTKARKVPIPLAHVRVFHSVPLIQLFTYWIR